MRSKVVNYVSYVLRFIKSPNKKKIINELFAEVQSKGIITGVRSLLHKKSRYYDDSKESLQVLVVIKKYKAKKKYTLSAGLSPKVSVIIPMYNQVRYTFNCICSVIENNPSADYEIIIADDNSTDDTSLLRSNFENIVYIKNETNLGFLRNCNNAAKQARGQYLVFLNNDTQVQKDWLAELLCVFDNYMDVGLAGSKLIYPNGKLQEAGGIVWQDGSAWNYGNRDNPNAPQYNYVKEVDYISGASIMIPATIWKELGGFDEIYLPAYCEDSDLCFRLRDKGYKVIYQPFSRVVHFEGITHGTDLKKGIKQYQLSNQQKFFERWERVLLLKSKNGENVFTERDRTTGKKHVLVVDHYLPKVDKDAGSRTIANFMDSLLELGYKVKFLGENAIIGRQNEKSFQLRGIEVLYGRQFDFAVRGWRNYLLANMHMLDAILLSRASVCRPMLSFLREHNYKGNIIYYGHDLGFLRLEKEAVAMKNDSLKKEAKKLKEAEDYMYQHADNSLVCGFDELAYLETYITTALHYVPPYFFNIEKNILPFEGREGIFFVGGFNHPPNRDAMKWFLDEVYAPLHDQGVRFTIAGSQMPGFIPGYKKKYNLLTVLPDVSAEELDMLYSKTRMAVVPLLSGAGVKGKVIEAMAKGVPVVGTEVAFEGMPKVNDFLYKGYNSARELADRILELHSNKQDWETLSHFGLNYVLKNFQEENMKEVFENILGKS